MNDSAVCLRLVPVYISAAADGGWMSRLCCLQAVTQSADPLGVLACKASYFVDGTTDRPKLTCL